MVSDELGSGDSHVASDSETNLPEDLPEPEGTQLHMGGYLTPTLLILAIMVLVIVLVLAL